MFIPSQQGDTSFQRRQFLREKMLNSVYFPQVKISHVFVFGKFLSMFNLVVFYFIKLGRTKIIHGRKHYFIFLSYVMPLIPPACKNISLSLAGSCPNCNQMKESQLYDDIVVFDFLDTYMNLTIKTIVSLNWGFKAYNTDIILKVDDDVLLNVTDVQRTVLRHLHNQTEYVGNYIRGCCRSGLPVIRDLQHKWGDFWMGYSHCMYSFIL